MAEGMILRRNGVLITDKYSTLPPPITTLTAEGGDTTVTASFELLDSAYDAYLGDTAYILVLKQGSVPESPVDGTAIKFDKTGAVL